jgi:elongation factor P
MYETSDIRKGLKVLIDGSPYNVVEFQFVKPGKGQAFTRTKLKNMMTGAVIERTFKSGEKLAPADLEERQMQYLYPDGDSYVFMDTKSYDQMSLSGEQLGDNRYYLLDGINVDILLFEGRPIDITPPTFVELRVTETEPGHKGDTTSNVTKAATLETGLEVQVPLFVENDEVLKIDTRTGAYVERVKK